MEKDRLTIYQDGEIVLKRPRKEFMEMARVMWGDKWGQEWEETLEDLTSKEPPRKPTKKVESGFNDWEEEFFPRT